LSLVDDPGVHAELLYRGGSAATMAGRTDEGIELLERATIELRSLERESEALESVTAAARALAAAGRADAATALIDAEVGALPPDATDRGTTEMLVLCALNRLVSGRVDDRTRDILDRATRLAEGLGERRLLADVLGASGILHNHLGNWVLASTLGAASVELAREVPYLGGLYRALTNYGQLLADNDEPSDAVLEEALIVGQRLGNPVIVALGVCNVTRGHLRRGRWDELVKEVGQYLDGVTTRTGASHSEPILHLALVAAWRGDLSEAAHLRPQAEACVTDDAQDQTAFRTYELLLDRAMGQAGPTFIADVERHLDDVVASYGWRSDNPPLLWPAAVDAALEDGDLPAVERLLARLDALSPGHRRPFLSAESLRARALLAVARGDGSAEVEPSLRAAIAQLGHLRTRPNEARTRLDLRDWLRTQGRDADAELAAEPVSDVARALGAVELLDRLDREARS
jgi:tetratricopeptide (TPR) repeat protein